MVFFFLYLNVLLVFFFSFIVVNCMIMVYSGMKGDIKKGKKKGEGREVREKGEIFFWLRLERKRERIVFKIK